MKLAWKASVLVSKGFSWLSEQVMVLAARRQTGRLDDGMVELWGTQAGLDEEGCVCSEAACFFRRYHQEADDGEVA